MPLVFLPGALDGLEGSDAVAERLGAERALIRIAWRPDDRFDGLIARILSAADAAGAARFDLLGQSYGGWIAQCLARLHPQRVRRIVLSHSFALRPGDRWRFRLASGLLERMPLALIRPLLLKRIRRALAPLRRIDPALVDRHLATLRHEMARPDFRGTLVAQQRCMAGSLMLQGRVTAPVLIVESDTDPLVGARARAALRARYPDAAVQRFADAGHISAMVETDSYLAAVKAFLDG